jgi:hypothetical protein
MAAPLFFLHLFGCTVRQFEFLRRENERQIFYKFNYPQRGSERISPNRQTISKMQERITGVGPVDHRPIYVYTSTQKSPT